MENNTPAKKQLPAFVILGIIALVAALVLAVTNVITRGPIKEHEMAALREAFAAVMPAEDYEAMTVPGEYDVRSLYAAKNGGEIIGYCVTAAGMGYNGDVAVTLGVGLDGLVTGAAVGDTSFAETPGFGARAKEPAFQEQFAGLDAVNGGTFEALSGATVTSTAVLTAVNKALACVDEVALNQTPAASPLVAFGAPAEKPAASGETTQPLTGNVLQGEAHGFQSDVVAQLTLDADGAIASLSFDSSNETEGLGTRVGEDTAFAEQFIGKTGPFVLGEGIDAVTGATVSSTAAVEAVNAALTAETSAAGELTGTAQGFQSEVKVALTVVDGAVASFTVESSGETEGLGVRCATDEAFLNQFIGQTGPFTLGENIDALSGATVTSTAVVEAANAALASAGAPATELPVTSLTSNDDADLGVRADGAAVVVPNADYTGELNVALTVEQGQVTGGEFAEPDAQEEAPAEQPEAAGLTATKKGFQSDVSVTVELNDDGTVAALTVDSSDETEGLGQKAMGEAFTSQFIGKAAPFTIGENIDAITGATITSQAVVDLMNELVPAQEAQEEAPAEQPEAAGLTASKKGFQSDVSVTVELNDDGTVAALTVDSSDETEGLGQKAMGEAFTSQFIGKAAPFTIGENIDAITGATITSQAVVDLMNELVPAQETKEEAPAEQTEAAGLTASKKGFQSDVSVTVELNDDGTVAALTVDSSDETEGLGQKAMDEAFTSQFIGKAAPFTISENIDAITGATITSQAVVDLMNELVPAQDAKEETPAEQPEEQATADLANKDVIGTAPGKFSDIVVHVTTDANGAVKSIVVNASGETKNVGTRVMTNGKFVKQFYGQTAPFALGEGIDALSGATVTCQAVVDAVNAALLGEPVQESVEAAPAADLANTDAIGTAPGKFSDIVVHVTTDASGAVKSIVVNASGETKNVGTRVMTNGKFVKQFYGQTAPFALGEGIDALSGATVTCQAVVDAVNAALLGE